MPKKKIVIDGIIGWDVYGSTIRKKLDAAEKSEIEIELASPGGFVYDGIEIFNIIRNYSRDVAPVTIRLMGLAASMASYISLAGDKLIAEDNAVFMIHNVWTFAIGDYRDLNKTANEIESLTNLLAKEYAKKSGKTLKSIRELMDGETYFYGDESLDAGFVDEIIESESDDKKDKAQLVTLAKGRVKNVFDKMQQSEKSKKDLEKAVALLPKDNGILNTPHKNVIVEDDEIINMGTITIEEKTQSKSEVKEMNLQELLSKNPGAMAEFNIEIKKAKSEGMKDVQDRIDIVKPFLNNENYEGMGALAVDVLSGKAETSALLAAVTAYDMLKEKDKSKAAKDDTKDLPDTPPLKGDLPKENGDIESEGDFQAEIARRKGDK